jgi:peptide-methionine (S)-S-oxide reductase
MMNTRAVPRFHEKILAFPNGAYDVFYESKRYLMRKETLLDGKLVKVYARELGGNNFISLNYYPLTADGLLKPCEMSDEKVISFILDAEGCDNIRSKGETE